MTSLKRFLDSCRCKRVDQQPVWLMRQAGRHLPEYQALRAEHDFLEMLTEENLIVEVSLQPWRRYGIDGVIIFSDILLLPMAMGMELMFLEGQGPKFKKLIASEEDLKNLKPLEPKKDILFLTDALKKIKKETGDEAALIGFAGSPWTVASYLMKEHEVSASSWLLERLTKETIVYLKAQISAGVDVIQIFDSWGGSLTKEEYAVWSGPHIKEIVSALKPTGVPVILYIKESKHLIEEMIQTGADVLSIGWETSLEEAKAMAKGKTAIQGNLNPHILMQATPAEIQRETEIMLETMKDYPGYIANLGHGVLPKTPVENVEAFVEKIKNQRSNIKDTD